MAEVICVYCKERFDRKKVEFVEIGARRYCHKTCWEKANANKTQAERDYEELLAYIQMLFKQPVSNMIIKQIREYKTAYNYTYTGVLKTLKYLNEVKKIGMSSEYGIALVQYRYEEAKHYYYDLMLAQSLADSIKINDEPDEVITIAAPKQKFSYKEFKLED